MTTYGTIPSASSSSPPGSSNLEFISRAKERMTEGLGTRRPWKEMIHRHTIGLPSGFGEAMSRIRTNLAYFRMNYAVIVLAILFLSLLWHPISLIVFVIMMAVWLFLYFLRDEPLVIMNRMVSDRVVLVILSVVTIIALLLTRATANILGAVIVGVVVVLVHAALRKTDDLFLDGDAAESGAFSGGGAGLRRPLHESSPSSS